MNSINFEFLRPHWPELAGLGGFAETYSHTDPIASLTKLRSFCEQVVGWTHQKLRLSKPHRATLIDLLDNQSFKDAVPSVILTKLHALRIHGNNAVHSNKGDTATAIRHLQDAYNIGCWMYVNFAKGNAKDCLEFIPPPEGGLTGFQQRKEKKAILAKIQEQEALMQNLLAQLEAERSKVAEVEASKAELEAALQAGQQSVHELEEIDPQAFNEQETRRYLIDLMLTEAGWKVGPGRASTDDVKKEFKVLHQPTDSGVGYIDYLLMAMTENRWPSLKRRRRRFMLRMGELRLNSTRMVFRSN